MAERPERSGWRRLALRRRELVAFAIFAGAGLLALPLVKDAYMLQQIWLSLCAAVGWP